MDVWIRRFLAKGYYGSSWHKYTKTLTAIAKVVTVLYRNTYLLKLGVVCM